MSKQGESEASPAGLVTFRADRTHAIRARSNGVPAAPADLEYKGPGMSRFEALHIVDRQGSADPLHYALVVRDQATGLTCQLTRDADIITFNGASYRRQ